MITRHAESGPQKENKIMLKKSVELIPEHLKESGLEEAIICHYVENNITPEIAKKLGFTYHSSVVSEVSKKEIKCHVKK